VIAEVTADIWFCSSLRYAGVFVRLCDVDPGGRSWNVCDSLTSLTSANEVTCATVRLWPTAHRPPLQGWPPDTPASFQRRIPPVRPQPG
jgi:uncharacterized protein